MYLLFAKGDGSTACQFFGTRDVVDASASGIKAVLVSVFDNLGVDNGPSKLVGICVDGAAVNLGVRRGLVALLREDLPWLVAIHCLNHRLKFAVKDAFTKTYMDEVSTMLVDLYYVYEKSPKCLRELKAMGNVLEESVGKPEKVHGTRWLQYKSRALSSLIMAYPVICAHLESMAVESSVKPADKARFKSYLKKLTSFKFVLHMLFFNVLLNPLATLSCHLQGHSDDLPFTIANLDSVHLILENLKVDNPEVPSELSQFIAAAEKDDQLHFQNVKLSGVQPNVLSAFMMSRSLFTEAIGKCIHNHFDDLQQGFFKAVCLLDTTLWLTDRDDLAAFDVTDVSLAVEHFRRLL